MKHLSKFTPAELFFLLRKEKRRHLKELLKITFLDLLLKQILLIKEVQKELKKTTQVYRYVENGPKFYGYKPLSHEAVFLDAFRKNSDIRIIFKSMVKIGYQNARSHYHYKSVILEQLTYSGYIKQNILQQVFGSYSLTEEGLDITSKIRAEISQLEKQLPELIRTTDEKAMEILKTINGNIYLINTIGVDLLEHINKAFLAATKEDKQNGDYGFACSDFADFGHTFDNSWSHDSGGCSGDGGCSGCGGCGGD